MCFQKRSTVYFHCKGTDGIRCSLTREFAAVRQWYTWRAFKNFKSPVSGQMTLALREQPPGDGKAVGRGREDGGRKKGRRKGRVEI